MIVRENVVLAPYTTLKVGGPAQFFIEAENEVDVDEAIVFAKEKKLPLFVLGAGSNIIVPDEGISGVVLYLRLKDVVVKEEESSVSIEAGAGASWDAVVDEAIARDAYGIENLAGVPGSVGGAVVQNIGAYGGEFSNSFVSARVIDRTTGEHRTVTKEEAAFGYRNSIFKTHPELIICTVTLRCSKQGEPNLLYPDLVRAKEEGVALSTPKEIAAAVRAIRARKFSANPEEGSAGSFFKNPSVTPEKAEELTTRYPGLPTFPQADGTVKVQLAWILDHVLSLKGHEKDNVRLFERQPLVLVTRPGARAEMVHELAQEVVTRVHDATGIAIEPEVETFGTRK